MSTVSSSKSLEEVHGSVDTRSKSTWKRILSFFGPAYLVSVGYMDPGNWATDIEGGSRYGYALVWVLVMSNIMAIILQSLCARLGIVYKKDLAQVNRETYPPVINFCLYILAEVAIAACDLAEILGMAIGLKLLFHLPMLYGVGITMLDTFLLLYLQKLGIRKMEAFIISLIAIIFVSFGIELFFSKPEFGEIAKGVIPSLPDQYALYIAIGIIGATVMPHNLYLHSALVQTRKIGDDDESKRKAIRLNNIDSTIALNLALFVNAAILILAGTVFHKNGYTEINSIESAHELLSPLVGKSLAPILFAVALIAAGQSSTVTGTLAGQIVMEGYLDLRINPWLRRVITRLVAILPAMITIFVAGEEKVTDLLILSQVILSIQLAFAVIPLIFAVSNKDRMKQFTIKPLTLAVSVMIAAVILYLNLKMVFGKAFDFLSENAALEWKVVVIAGLIVFVLLLIVTIVYPFISKRIRASERVLHQPIQLDLPILQPYKKIALALDFSDTDSVVMAHALRNASESSQLLLIHVVESANAKILGKETDDKESIQDKEQLDYYKAYLEQQTGKRIDIELGYRNRVHEIVRICEDNSVDLLIMGAHGHKGVKDILYGATIDAVRHQLHIPVLIVK